MYLLERIDSDVPVAVIAVCFHTTAVVIQKTLVNELTGFGGITCVDRRTRKWVWSSELYDVTNINAMSVTQLKRAPPLPTDENFLVNARSKSYVFIDLGTVGRFLSKMVKRVESDASNSGPFSSSHDYVVVAYADKHFNSEELHEYNEYILKSEFSNSAINDGMMMIDATRAAEAGAEDVVIVSTDSRIAAFAEALAIRYEKKSTAVFLFKNWSEFASHS